MRIVTVGGALWVGLPIPLAAQVPKDVQAREMELLRKTLAEQQRHPDQIIRTPQTLAFSTNPAVVASRAELERQYLDDKITAKQLQKALEQLQAQERRQAVAAAKVAKPEPNVPKTTSTTPATAAPATAAPAPGSRTIPPKQRPAPTATTATSTARSATTNGPPPETTAEQKKLSEVESRIEEMLRLKAAREKAAATNAVGTAETKNPSAGPQTKRQRLDTLLKQYVDGKLSEADYNAQRTKIVAEPD